MVSNYVRLISRYTLIRGNFSIDSANKPVFLHLASLSPLVACCRLVFPSDAQSFSLSQTANQFSAILSRFSVSGVVVFLS